MKPSKKAAWKFLKITEEERDMPKMMNFQNKKRGRHAKSIETLMNMNTNNYQRT